MPLPYDTNALIKQTKDMLAQTQAQGTTAFAGSTYDTNRAGAVQAITPAAMTPQTPVAPVVTPETPLPIVSPYTLTAPEQQAQVQETGLTKSIADLTAQLDPSFRRQSQIDQEAKFGIQQKSDVYKGFQDKNTSLQAEAQGIQLQLQQDIQNQQNLAQQGGANVTKGGLAPQTRALQTQANQSLLTNAIQQFGNNANLAASQRDLSSAMAYADRAVEAEFLPKEKALAVAQANLTNLRNSAELTSAQEKRADARQAQIDADKAEIAEAKKMKQDTSDARIKAISNNTGNPKMDSTIIAALNAAKSPEEVAAILQYVGLSTLSEMEQLDIDYKNSQIEQNNKSKYTFQTLTTEDEWGNKSQRIVALDPATGQQVGTVGQGGTITSSSGRVIGNTNTPSGVGQRTPEQAKFSQNALTYAQEYLDTGKLPSAADMKYAHIKPEEIMAASKTLAKTPTKDDIAREDKAKSAIEFAKSKIDVIKSILDKPDDYQDAVGANRTSMWNFVSKDKTDAILNIEKLVSQETLNALIALKSTGATLGAISEKELGILEASATTIAKARKENWLGDGIDGYDMSEDLFKAEIEKMQTAATNLIADMERQLKESEAKKLPAGTISDDDAYAEYLKLQ